MAQQPDYVQITLKNGGWDGMTSKEFMESDEHAVASRIVELARHLVLADAGLVFRSGNMMAVIQRETTQFRFMGSWMDLRFGNEQGKPIIMADDERNQIGAWAYNSACVQFHSMQLEREVMRMNSEAEARAQFKVQMDEAKENGVPCAPLSIPAPPPGMSALQFMKQSGRLDSAWFDSTPSTDQATCDSPRVYPVGVF